ncbi:CBN-LGL-1 protein [Caenorhabditis brenneri]|uniref:CBN-LGL-1 protein n=1 Tax=Caenorhabditis brenneri TaxID=135651 RepID=G0N7L8_CAEBE|nr:CBN-LGL-1 protein [Caenorhabditis brenneri]
MSSLIRYIRSKFTHEPEEHAIEQYAVFDSGDRGGFPSDVITFDYCNGCIVVGTQNGDVIFYGSHGASWSINLSEDTEHKTKIECIFMVSSNIALVLCNGPMILPLHIKDGIITKKEENRFSDSPKYKWSTAHVQKLSDDAHALIFCINNTIYRIKSKTIKLEVLINKEDFEKWLPEDSELSSITTFPEKSNVIMLISDNGNIGVFNESNYVMTTVLKNFEDEAIQKLCWSSEKKKNVAYGISCNNLYTKWEFSLSKDCHITATEIDVCSSNQFGPYPCHQIRHFKVCPSVSKTSDNFLVYQGGKSSGKYDDRDLVSICHDDTVEKLELSSEIVGIVAIDGSYESSKKNGVILICTKCEIVGIDLETEALNMMQPKYFLSINNSTPTTHTKAIEIEENVWSRLEAASKSYWESNHMSTRDWPLYFQKKIVNDANHQRSAYRQVYISGHSNGNICIWASGGVAFVLLLVIKTSSEFEGVSGFDTNNDGYYNDEEEMKKPVRSVGIYDPFDDEEEMCITRLHFDPKSGIIIASNRGGYILMYELCDNARTHQTWDSIAVSCNQSSSDPRKRQLVPRKTDLQYISGYQIKLKNESELPLVFLMHPSHRVTDIAYLHKYHCLAIGSNFGVAMLDVNHGYLVFANSFNDDHLDTSVVSANQFQRFKSVKKSLRKTFRRKKKTPDSTMLIGTSVEYETHTPDKSTSQRIEEYNEEGGYMERPIEAREDLGVLDCYAENSRGTVTCLRTMRFPINDDKNVDDIIAVGLHEGNVYFYVINEHDVGIRMTFKSEQVKKISIPHKQPVINVDITNEEGYFSVSTRIVVITEEQLRIYNCQPMFKRESYKITALEGLKIKNGTVARILSKKSSNNFESFVVLVTNNGTLRIHSVQKASQFETRKFINPIDVVALNSSCLSRDGEVAYLIKSSELQRSTVNFNFRGWSCAPKS